TVLPMELEMPVPSGAAIIIVSAFFFLLATSYRIIRKN
ncbi:metal ABC transporter permease, partial [Aliivibrio sp. S2MY1]|nr:metal ABC transporter permease [Aliivibrio sp. S2MY1]